jgi:DNA polymerase-3 subunit epsilon
MYLRKFVSDYVCLDLETTGLSKVYSDIIEIGLCRVRNNEIVDTYTTLIHPDENKNYREYVVVIDDEGEHYYYDDEDDDYDEEPEPIIPSYITRITGIDDEMIKGKPYFKDVANEIKTFIGNDIILGHHVSFDIGFLGEAFKESLENDYIDTMGLSKTLIKDSKNFKLTTLCKYFKINRKAHRSINDVLNTIDLYNELFNYAKENNLTLEYNRNSHYDYKDIKPTINVGEIEMNPLFGMLVCFTGSLDRMIRKDAMQFVVNKGGDVQPSVTKKTNLLVLGDNSMCKAIKDGKSIKYKKALQLMEEGQDIKVIDESMFYELLK